MAPFSKDSNWVARRAYIQIVSFCEISSPGSQTCYLNYLWIKSNHLECPRFSRRDMGWIVEDSPFDWWREKHWTYFHKISTIHALLLLWYRLICVNTRATCDRPGYPSADRKTFFNTFKEDSGTWGANAAPAAAAALLFSNSTYQRRTKIRTGRAKTMAKR